MNCFAIGGTDLHKATFILVHRVTKSIDRLHPSLGIYVTVVRLDAKQLTQCTTALEAVYWKQWQNAAKIHIAKYAWYFTFSKIVLPTFPFMLMEQDLMSSRSAWSPFPTCMEGRGYIQ